MSTESAAIHDSDYLATKTANKLLLIAPWRMVRLFFMSKHEKWLTEFGTKLIGIVTDRKSVV